MPFQSSPLLGTLKGLRSHLACTLMCYLLLLHGSWQRARSSRVRVGKRSVRTAVAVGTVFPGSPLHSSQSQLPQGEELRTTWHLFLLAGQEETLNILRPCFFNSFLPSVHQLSLCIVLVEDSISDGCFLLYSQSWTLCLWMCCLSAVLSCSRSFMVCAVASVFLFSVHSW